MADDKWIFKARLYPHFDHAILDSREAKALVTDPQKVTSHAFHPFLEYDLKNRKFAKHLEKLQYLESGEDLSDFDVNKLRSIKYASLIAMLKFFRIIAFYYLSSMRKGFINLA